MCSGPRKPSTPPLPKATAKDSAVMASLLLELAAADDVVAFRRAVEEEKVSALDAACQWYGPSAAGVGRLSLELRTPAMVAALYGSTAVLAYVLSVAPSEAARASGTDGATALHLAATGGSANAVAATHLLLAAGASADALAFSGLRAGDLLPRSTAAEKDRSLRVLLKSPAVSPSSSPKKSTSPAPAPEPRKEYPPDLTLPDLKSGLFSTDEFRMYSFKVKPCSRAYSHDWTECPFVHPGENARRRDPRRYSYSCVPCPEFRKGGSCRKGDNCEYAHGVFECWLHPAQYRTRLCKDEVGCARRICFFAHKPEELRAVNPSAVSVGMQPTVSSPRSSPPKGLDMGMLSPSWPSSQASRLKTALGARELDFDLELLALDQYQQKLFDKVSSPRSSWGSAGGLGSSMPPTAPSRTVPDYTDFLGSVDPAMLSQLHALSLKQAGDMPAYSSMPDTQLHMASSPMVSANTAFGLDHSMAKAIMSSRASAFAKRSQSFIDRGGRAPATRSLMLAAPTSSPSMLSDWGSPDGKLDWCVQGDELHKFRKSVSFAFRGQSAAPVATPAEPDVSWVNSLVKDGHAGDIFAQWPEQEQMVA
ncbi:zinc finger CCCH domain-containing protein 33-like [Phragmites australis]|uniref:zinc finger CCCH domain-containing protein 33-like n=1 Tax=Phragmites australis TaxID=29695 RepID=UPI002D79B5AF|nr:zinc finger CCCH domain-containing protein 33-like [Phragmites australis]